MIDEEKRAALELMAEAPVLYFTTIDPKDFPQTRAIFNLRNRKEFPPLTSLFDRHEEDMMILIATNTSSDKVAHIAGNPAACAYYCIPERFHGIMLSGSAEHVADMDVKRSLWQKGWELYYPGGPGDPDFSIFRLLPRLAKGWHGDHKFEFEPGA